LLFLINFRKWQSSLLLLKVSSENSKTDDVTWELVAFSGHTSEQLGENDIFFLQDTQVISVQ
jgi:hypothetical protein